MGLAKAEIKNTDTNEVIKVLFNPKEYSLDKSVSWEEHKTPGTDAPKLEFTQGEASTLSLELFIDTTLDNSDARYYTDQLQKLTIIEPKTKDKGSKKADNAGRPPICEFTWEKLTFKGVVTKLACRFTMFNRDGKPLRAVVNISFKEFRKDGDAAWSGKGASPSGTLTSKQGDTIDNLAAQALGDPTLWKKLAEANDLDDPLAGKRGTMKTA